MTLSDPGFAVTLEGTGLQCHHGICTCVVANQTEFCSEACRIVVREATQCGCGHAECKGALGIGGPVQML